MAEENKGLVILHPVLNWNQGFYEYVKSCDGILKKNVPHLSYMQKSEKE
jgi:hypothetical protein